MIVLSNYINVIDQIYKHYAIFVIFLFSITNTTAQIVNHSVQVDTFYNLSDVNHLLLKNTPLSDFPLKISPDIIKDYYTSRDTLHFYESVSADTIIISYRVFPKEIFELKGIDTSAVSKDILYSNIEEYKPTRKLTEWSHLEYYGNFSRGLSFGNRQSPGVQSNFDLNVKGTLGDDIELLASMTDNSIPLQPNGNTQRIQEFDNVFIRLSQKENFFEIGDLLIENRKPYFLSYDKKIQGVSGNYINRFGPNKSLSSRATLALSKGKFARTPVTITEGNQGPYKLTIDGNPNEYFFIIAGSEIVYLDGVPLVRGEDNDYTIDYNLAELTFTSNRYIGTESRIFVEFEYNNQEYQNSLLSIENSFNTKHWEIYSSFLSTQDMKNSFIPFDLDDQTKDFLSQAGDSESSVLISSIRKNENGYDPNLVMYELTDSLGIDSVLVRSKNPNKAVYLASFLYVGPQNGDYTLRNNDDNQAIYVWLAPVDSIKQGSYSPVFSIKPPEQQAQWSVGANYIKNQHAWNTEVSITDLDLNRFSSRDNQDNQAASLSTEYTYLNNRLADSTKSFQWTTRYEYKGKNFSPINPYRSTEFNRNWNLTKLDLAPLTENYLLSFLRFRSKSSDTKLSSSFLTNTDQYSGQRFGLDNSFSRKRWRSEIHLDWLRTKWYDQRGTFFKPRGRIELDLNKQQNLTLYLEEEQEYNRLYNAEGDDLDNSFYYYIHGIGTEWKPNEKSSYSLSYRYRRDKFPIQEKISDAYASHNILFHLNWYFTQFLSTKSQITYRLINIIRDDNTPSTIENGDNLLANFELNYTRPEKGITGFIFSQLGTGKEPKRDIRYIRVEPGKGDYAYIDFNGDGIQQTNEFVLANFQNEGEYIRVNTLTNDFVDSKKMSLRSQMRVDLSRLLPQGQKKWYGRFSLESNYINNRSYLEDAFLTTTQAIVDIPDSLVVSQIASGRHALYYQKGNIFFQSFLEMVTSDQKSLLTTGIDDRKKNQYNLSAQQRLSKKFFTQFLAGKTYDYLSREAFTDNDYSIDGWQTKANINYLLNRSTKITLSYHFFSKMDSPTDAKTKQHEVQNEITWSPAVSQSISANFKYSLVTSNQDLSANLENAMLSGLRTGNNIIWDLLYQLRIKESIHLNLSYQGRKLGQNQRVVHTGNAQITALF